jgi:predicted ester cyclase
MVRPAAGVENVLMSPSAVRSAQVVRALVAGDVLSLQPLVHPEVIDHSAGPGQPEGWAGLRERAMTMCAAVHDSAAPVEVLCVDGDTAMCRVQLVGVPRRGSLLPQPGSLVLVFVLRFAGDLLRELWTSTDVRLPADVSLA